MWVPPSGRSSWKAFWLPGKWVVAVLRGLHRLTPLGAKVVLDHGSWRPRGRFWPHVGASGVRLIVPVVLANDQNGARTVGDISATDREVIVRQAAVAGDQVARETAQRDGRASNGQEPLGSILRKASKIILTYGRPSLPNPVCAWADKIYGW